MNKSLIILNIEAITGFFLNFNLATTVIPGLNSEIFNNSGVSNNQSAVDGIETPWDPISNTYLRSPGQPFSPISYTTRYECAY